MRYCPHIGLGEHCADVLADLHQGRLKQRGVMVMVMVMLMNRMIMMRKRW